MNKQLLKLARELDEAGEHEEAEQLLELAKHEEEEGEPEEAEQLRELAEHEEEEGAECCTNKDLLQGIFDSLSDIADKLDELGAVKEANLTDELIKKLAAKTQDKYDAKTHNQQTFIPNKKRVKPEDKHHIPEYQATGDKALSTRNCPDHFGVMLSRVMDGVSECPLDGKRYNWSDKGSVAGQTPSSSTVPIPSRMFDPTEDVIGKNH
jgi:hypothetical protein